MPDNIPIPTPEELGRIAGEHVDDGVGCCVLCIGWNDDGNFPLPFPCTVAKLYALVLRQSGMMVAAGLPCACDCKEESTVWFSGPHEPDCDLARCDHCRCTCEYYAMWERHGG